VSPSGEDLEMRSRAGSGMEVSFKARRGSESHMVSPSQALKALLSLVAAFGRQRCRGLRRLVPNA
jgi:hypothetical protein